LQWKEVDRSDFCDVSTVRAFAVRMSGYPSNSCAWEFALAFSALIAQRMHLWRCLSSAPATVLALHAEKLIGVAVPCQPANDCYRLFAV
jgi:hypothetical protein